VTRRLIFAFSVFLLVAACTPLAVVDGVSLGTTDKLLSDHVVSVTSGKDCSYLRQQQGRTYCKEDEVNPNYNELHCYRNLGGVTCYDRPAFNGAQSRVGLDGGQAPTK